MSESTTTTTDAGKTAEATAIETGTATQSDSADKPLGEGGEKALKAEREARAAAEKQTAALQKQIDEIEAAKLSDLERAQKEAADAKTAVATAQAEALRYRIAAKHSITDEDAELFLTGTDEETLTKQAARLVERNPSATAPRADLTQGGNNGAGTGTPEGDFANFMTDQLTNK